MFLSKSKNGIIGFSNILPIFEIFQIRVTVNVSSGTTAVSSISDPIESTLKCVKLENTKMSRNNLKKLNINIEIKKI